MEGGSPLLLLRRTLREQHKKGAAYGSDPALTTMEQQRSSGGKCGEERVGVGPEHLDHSVYISGVQQGTLRYFGKTKFQSGQWCGIQLPSPQGKHDGSVGGVRYFKCPPNHGIFAPASKVTLLPQTQRLSLGAETKGKRPPEPQKMFSVQCGAGRGLTEPLEQKRRKMDPETHKLNWSAVKFKKSVGVKLPNFAQINMMNLRDELERSVEAIPSTAEPVGPVGEEQGGKGPKRSETFTIHRPNNLPLQGEDEVSEELSEVGLFGQSTPELSFGLSSAPTSPEEEEGGIQEEEEDELYRHLRSPSIDNLHLEEEEEEEETTALTAPPTLTMISDDSDMEQLHTPQGRENRGARVIDGSLYTQEGCSSTSQHKENINSTSESGFYSSCSSSSSLPRHTSKSGSECESIDHTLLCDSSPTGKSEVSSESSSASSFNDTLVPPEPPAPTKLALPTPLPCPSVQVRKKRGQDDMNVGGMARIQVLRENKLRSQSVSCLSSSTSTSSWRQVAKFVSPKENVLERSVASSGGGSGGGGSRGVKKVNKWDHVMKKINEGKGVKMNVKDVKGKVFEKVGVVADKKRMERMDSTSSECSEGGGGRSLNPIRHQRVKKEGRRPHVDPPTKAASSSKVIPQKKQPPTTSRPSPLTPPKHSPPSSETKGVGSGGVSGRGNNRKTELLPPTNHNRRNNVMGPPPPKASHPPPPPTRSKEVKPLREKNGRVLPVCNNNNKGSGPTTTTTSSTTQSGARVRVRDEKERVLEGEKLSLLEQLESVREELERVKEEGDRKEGEIRRLVELNEEQLRVEVDGCARKLEAMSVQLRSCEQERERVCEELCVTKDRLAILESKLEETIKSRDETLEQVRLLGVEKEQVEAVGLRLEDKLSVQASAHRLELDKLREAQEGELHTALANLRLQRLSNSSEDVLVKEVQSMSAVIELSQKRIKELQVKENLLEMREEELQGCQRELGTVTARVEDLEAQLVLMREERLGFLGRESVAEEALREAFAHNQFMAKEVDELRWKLENPDVIAALPTSASQFKEEEPRQM